MQLPAQSAQTSEARVLETALFEIKRVIVGQDRAIERLLVCLLAQGHCLLEGVPGLAKTLAMETLATVSGGTFARIQFTPDLLPADIVGTRIYRASSERFDVELGPVFANFVLADEVNRAPAKVQSALLEVMAEHHVSIGGRTFAAPDPFLVLATQNPVEQEGVYPLPEAQRDRFLMKVVVGYPHPAEEIEIVNRMGVSPPVARQVLDPEQVRTLQEAAKSVYVDRGVVEYAVNLVLATREPGRFGLGELEEFIEYGASPRASLGLVAAGRALALLRGRWYALPQDVFDVAPEILRHRLVLSYEALAQGLHVDQLSSRILATVPAPRVAPSQDQYRRDEYQADWSGPTGQPEEAVFRLNARQESEYPRRPPAGTPASLEPASDGPLTATPATLRAATPAGGAPLKTGIHDIPKPPSPGPLPAWPPIAGTAPREPAEGPSTNRIPPPPPAGTVPSGPPTRATTGDRHSRLTGPEKATASPEPQHAAQTGAAAPVEDPAGDHDQQQHGTGT